MKKKNIINKKLLLKQEKELRFIINSKNFKEIIKKIKEAGFLETFILKIKDTYFDNKNYTLLKNLEGYRKRETEIISYKNIPSTKSISFKFIYKKKRNDKVYEKEFKKERFNKEITNLNNKILIKKNRFVFEREKTEVVIDVIRGLGNFLEIECKEKKDPSYQVLKDIEFKENWIKLLHRGVTELWLEKHSSKDKNS